jgi:hypothetical protein
MQFTKTALLGLACGALFIAGFWVGRSNVHIPTDSTALNRRPDEELDHAQPLVSDAIRRWSLKAAVSEESVRQNWIPRGMFVPTRNQGRGMLCIQLQLKPGNLGGSPVYCYEDDFSDRDEVIKLVAEYSDIE